VACRRAPPDSATDRHRPAGLSLASRFQTALSPSRFSICTDENLDPQRLIETYFHRWDIEVNFARKDPARCRPGAGPFPRSVESALPSPSLPTPCCSSPPSAPLPTPEMPCCRAPSGCLRLRPPHLHSTGYPSAPRRSLGPRPRPRQFLPLRVHLPTSTSGEIIFPSRFGRLLRQCLIVKGPKARRRALCPPSHSPTS